MRALFVETGHAVHVFFRDDPAFAQGDSAHRASERCKIDGFFGYLEGYAFTHDEEEKNEFLYVSSLSFLHLLHRLSVSAESFSGLAATGLAARGIAARDGSGCM
jgi:hypothetical protein